MSKCKYVCYVTVGFTSFEKTVSHLIGWQTKGKLYMVLPPKRTYKQEQNIAVLLYKRLLGKS